MDIGNIISLFGGLGAFLFGMQYMGEGLKLAAGPKMKDILEKLTRNPVMGFLVGALVTVCIQSSSATTVMVMGFINAGIMDLAQATGVIFGANIGTTVTSILIALDVSGIAPVCMALGALLFLYASKKRHKYIGQVILGFGLLFQGLKTMSGAMAPLKDSAAFQKFILNAKNPLLGFGIGIILCAVIQSSSAAVGILQALAMQGLMPLHFAGYIVCGINVGSSTPPLLSALNAKNNAKRAAVIYLIFNVVGAILFIPLTLMTPLADVIASHVPSPAFQVSFYHILFKVVTGLILLPLTGLVVKITYRILPKQAHESAFRLEYIDSNLTGAPSVLALQVNKEIDRVAGIVRANLVRACDGLVNYDISAARVIREEEEVIDYLTAEIINVVTKASAQEMPQVVSDHLSSVFQFMNEIEQIGDHAVKILEKNEKCIEEKQQYSKEACDEFYKIFEQDLILFDESMNDFFSARDDQKAVEKARKTEESITEMSLEAQTNHMDRLKAGLCTFEQGLTFVQVLNSLARVANHCVAIAECGSETKLPEGAFID